MDALSDLANAINVCATKSDDYRVTAACHLAEAKRLCAEQGITFKDWASEHIKFSYDEARKLAKAGETGDPAKAIADMRERTKASVKKSRAVLRSTASRKPKPGVPIEVHDEEPDDDDDDEARMRQRGLAACCRMALASAEDAQHHVTWLLQHKPELIDDEVRTAIWDAYQFWRRVHENRASTLPQDGRSEMPVGDIGDIPPELDRRRTR